MLKILLLSTCMCVGISNAILYDCFTGKPINRTLLRVYEEKNNLGNCTVEIEPCDPNEWRKVDGSCINLKHPSRGTQRTPLYRVLPPVFSVDYEPRKAVSGASLPLPRRLRTELLLMGQTTDLKITQLFSYYILFMISDVLSSHDIINYLQNITTCCTPEGKNDYRCTPIEVPINDPVHRYSGVRCLNLTRPQSFQTYRCLDNGTTFERIVFQTPLFDLSHIYEYRPGFINQLRTFENGLMKIEEDDGELFPPSDPDSNYCYQNQLPRETRCHKYRKKNMIREGLIGRGGFRDLYDENVEPRMSDEYFYGMRWFHMIQKTNMKLYDKYGHYVRSFPMVNGTARTGFFAVDNNMQHIIQGSFRQLGGKPGRTIDYDMADRLLGGILFSSDAPTSDLKKGRYFGIQPYVNYKEFCTNRKYTSFADLKDSFRCEHLNRLKEVYQDPKDIELMAALWLEKPVKGGNIPETLYCLLTEQYKRTIKSDRHWYERPNRPHAFTKEQLKAIRKVKIAGVLCSIGDFVTEIQPHAFYAISNCNPLMKCNSSRIGKLDLTPWKESD